MKSVSLNNDVSWSSILRRNPSWNREIKTYFSKHGNIS